MTKGMTEMIRTDNSETLKNALLKIKALEEQIEKMKSDVKQEQSYWNECDMQYHLLQDLLDKWELEN